MPLHVSQSLSILIVEDDEVTREVAVQFLSAMGHACHVAKDGYEALERVSSWQPDVILMDISLPGMDGITAARRIRQALGSSRTRFIAMSAHVFAADIKTYLESGMDSYVAKPLVPEAIMAALAEALNQPSHIPNVDHAAWEADRATLGNEQMRKILSIAARILPERIADLRRALEMTDLNGLAVAAHAAVSTASAAGFSRLQCLFSDLEAAARAGDIARCSTSLGPVEELARQALEEAEMLISEDAGGLSTSVPAEQQRDSLLRVR